MDAQAALPAQTPKLEELSREYLRLTGNPLTNSARIAIYGSGDMVAFRGVPVEEVSTLAALDKVVELFHGLGSELSALGEYAILHEYAILQAVEFHLRNTHGFCSGWVGQAGTSYMVGDRVQHYGTLAWAVVEGVIPQRDGTLEMEVRREVDGKATWWASYHIGQHRPAQRPGR